jgi:hypothetical protein
MLLFQTMYNRSRKKVYYAGILKEMQVVKTNKGFERHDAAVRQADRGKESNF